MEEKVKSPSIETIEYVVCYWLSKYPLWLFSDQMWLSGYLSVTSKILTKVMVTLYTVTIYTEDNCIYAKCELLNKQSHHIFISYVTMLIFCLECEGLGIRARPRILVTLNKSFFFLFFLWPQKAPSTTTKSHTLLITRMHTNRDEQLN